MYCDAIVDIVEGKTCNIVLHFCSEILSAHQHADTDMLGRDVAVLKNRLHDTWCVASHGGVVRSGDVHHTVRYF